MRRSRHCDACVFGTQPIDLITKDKKGIVKREVLTKAGRTGSRCFICGGVVK